jgi:hypothetical protein
MFGALKVVWGLFLDRQWHRNQDANPVAVDQVYLIRDTTKCPNRSGAQGSPQPGPVKSYSIP